MSTSVRVLTASIFHDDGSTPYDPSNGGAGVFKRSDDEGFGTELSFSDAEHLKTQLVTRLPQNPAALADWVEAVTVLGVPTAQLSDAALANLIGLWALDEQNPAVTVANVIKKVST